MNTLTANDFRAGWRPSDDAIRGTRNGLLRMDNVQLDEFGALTMCRGSRLANPDPFLGGIHSIYSRAFEGAKYRYVGLTDGSVIRDNGAGNFSEVIVLAGNGSTSRAAFAAGFDYVYVCSGARRVKDLGGSHQQLGVQTPLGPVSAVSAATPEKPIPDSYDITLAEGSNEDSDASHFTADTDVDTFRVDAYRTFGSVVDTMNFGSGKYGTDLDFILFNVRIPDFSQLVRLQVILYFGTVDGSPDSTPDLTDYYSHEWLPTDDNFIRDGSNQWSTLGAHRPKFERIGTDFSKDWSNIAGMRIVATFLAPVEGFGFSGLKIVGSNEGPLTGKFEYKQVNVNNTGSYIAASAGGPSQGAFTEAYHSAITVTPDTTANDPQINEIWIYRRQVDGPETSPLASFLRVKVIESYSATPFDDIVSNDEAIEEGEFLNENLLSLYEAADAPNTDFPDDITYMEVNHFERTLYMSPREIWVSEKLNPDAVDLRATIRLSGDTFAKNLWMVKVGPSTILVGATNDIYEITGNLQELPDGSFDVNVRGLGVKQPPIQDCFCVYDSGIFYIAKDGVRRYGDSTAPFNGPLDLLFSNHERFGFKPVDLQAANYSVFSLAATRAKLFVQVTLQDSGSPRTILVYDFQRQYWYNYNFDPISLFAEEDGELLAGFSSSDPMLRILDTETGIDGTEVGQDIRLLFPKLDDNLPLNRKDSFTLKLVCDTGNRNITVNIYADLEDTTPTLLLGTVIADGLTEIPIDISGLIGVVKRYQLEIIGVGLFTFKLTEWAIEYDARPKQTLYLRIPPNNYGVAGRKRFPTIPMVLDTLGHDVFFSPIIDGVVQTGSTFNTSDKQVVDHLFTGEKNGYTVGGILSGVSYFEFYELVQPRPEAIEVLPDPQKYCHIPFTNLGTQSRKRFIAFAFVINTNGNNVTFTPVIDGVPGSTSTVNTDGKLTHIHYFTSDTPGTDIGGILSGSNQFEFYGVNLGECISEKMPSPAKFLLIPQDDYGTPARKRFSSYKFRINTKGQNVTFTPRVDGVNKTTSTVNTTEAAVHEHFFTNEDVIGINIGGSLSGSTEFEFYGPLRPRVVEEIPDRLKYFVVPENNFGAPSKKRIRTIPLVINTNGQPVTFTPVVDGVAGTPTTLNTPSKRTTFHYFASDSFGIDYKGILESVTSTPFEFYGMMKPEDVEIIPTGKLFDQIGPIELPKIGKLLGFRLRLIADSADILTYTIFTEDTQIGSPGTITTVAGKDHIYEVKLPKGINCKILRIELSMTSPFHRYYVRLHVNTSGMELEPKWILFGADPDQKPK